MTTIDNLIKSALETGLDCAQDIAHQVHEQYKGYKPHRHAAVDADVAEIKSALDALAKDVSLINEGNKAQPVREPSCDTCKHCTVSSQDSFEKTCFVCSHYYDSKYEVRT